MKWFKHMTASGSDEKLSALIDAMGMEGYGLWWRLLEVVATQMDESDKCEVTYTLPRWSLLLYCHHHRGSKLLVTLESLGLIETVTMGSNITVRIPNLLKFRDSHTKNLQAQGRKKLPATCKQEVEVEVEVKNIKPIVQKQAGKDDAYSEDFLSFWVEYPNKTGKGDAWKSWQKASPKLADVKKALEWQKKSVDWTKEGGKYIPMPSTYLNQRRWEDEPKQFIKPVPTHVPSSGDWT